nr:MAG TPA: Cytosine specific methyltransferase [Caudoviricetes sp.]
MEGILSVNELFSGIGAFRKALIRLGIPHEVVGISEIDRHAIKSYEAIYGATRNYGDISKVERLDYADLWTYGFPCQDISLAGGQAGPVKGVTRSGLLYEVERLLWRAKADGEAPKYLIMENVKNLIGKKFKKDFLAWCDALEEMGYKNFWQVLSAADYGVPQRRERLFCVSVRADLGQDFAFPEPVELKKRLIDVLEPADEVEERYFLSETAVAGFIEHTKRSAERGLGYKFQPVERTAETAKTVTTKEGLRTYSNFIREGRSDAV